MIKFKTTYDAIHKKHYVAVDDVIEWADSVIEKTPSDGKLMSAGVNLVMVALKQKLSKEDEQ